MWKLKTPLSGWCRLHGTNLQRSKEFSVNVQKQNNLQRKKHTHIHIGMFSLRSDSVEPTGLHLHQPIPPVGPRHSEIVNRPPHDAESFSPQGELGQVGTQAQLSAYSACPCWHAGTRVVVFVTLRLCSTLAIVHKRTTWRAWQEFAEILWRQTQPQKCMDSFESTGMRDR